MEKDNDDGFVMNIMGSAPSTKKSFISQNEKRKNKKEKFMEMLDQAKKDEYGRLYGNKEVGVAFTSSQYGSLSAMIYLKT